MAVSLNTNTENDQLNQKQSFSIEGVSYIIRTYFNSRKLDSDLERGGGWYVSLHDSDDIPIVTGLKLMPSRSMFNRVTNPAKLFTGHVICIDTLPQTSYNALDLDNYGQGKRYQLWYFTEQELIDAAE